MGVLRFFRYLCTKWADRSLIKLFGTYELCESAKSKGLNIDHLLYDLNSVFHPVAQTLYKYGNGKPSGRNPSLLFPSRKKAAPTPQIPEKVLFSEICKRTEDIRRIMNPLKSMYWAIDGVAGVSKQAQQRKRRFKGCLDSANKPGCEDSSSSAPAGFDSNAISTGTVFMEKLARYIDGFIQIQTTKNKDWQGRKSILSNQRVAGEGEHKCLAKGTKVLMYDGTVKSVEYITVGDIIIGDDGNPRTVTDLVGGEDELFEVEQTEGENYTVNGAHILSLRITGHKTIHWDSKRGSWVVGWFDREKLNFRRKSFSFMDPGIAKKSKEQAHKDAEVFASSIEDCDVLDISVRNYLKLPPSVSSRLYGYKCPGVNWDKKHVLIDPYILGLWLGDGSKDGYGFASTDHEIISEWVSWARKNDAEIVHSGPDNFRVRAKNPSAKRVPVGDAGSSNASCPACSKKRSDACSSDVELHSLGKKRLVPLTDRLSDATDHKKWGAPLRSLLEHYDLVGRKHIPLDYITTDRASRLELLAGIIDTDGSVSQEGRLVRISQSIEHARLAEDIVKLARSLGFKCLSREGDTTWEYKGEKKSGKALFITISGRVEEIPTRLEHKKCLPRFPGTVSKNSQWLKTSIKVTPKGVGSYYGFNVDGNRRYLLGDFTVTHNCLNYIRQYPKDSHVIVSPDADLIFLAMGLHMPNVYVFRENIFDDVQGAFFLVDVYALRECVLEELGLKDDKDEEKKRAAIDDFIIYCFMLGNDFLAQIPSLNIATDGMEILLGLYRKVMESHGHITYKKADGTYALNKANFKQFMTELASIEQDMIMTNHKRNRTRYPDTTLSECISYVRSESGGREAVLDFTRYRESYYSKKFCGVDIKTVVHEYLRGMVFVMRYYLDSIPSWTWCYPFHYAPFFTDMRDHVDDFDADRPFEPSEPLSPLEQLMSVLPGKSAYLLPEPLRFLLTSSSSPIIDFYPTDFEVDMEGKKQDYEGVILLPMINVTRLKKAFKMAENKLDEYDRKRNMPGRVYEYEVDEEGNLVQTSFSL